MSTIPQQIQALRQQIASLRSVIAGSIDGAPGYVRDGNYVEYGCKITQGLSSADMYLALDGSADAVNPDVASPPIRPEQYPNLAFVYGRLVYHANINTAASTDTALLLADAPATAGFGRYDIAYMSATADGSVVGIVTGIASAAAKTNFSGGGLTASFPGAYDPALLFGMMPLARVYVDTNVTGIANARIHSLRNFTKRT